MDPIVNPFAPGAGTQPPEFAGREDLLETVRIACARIRRGNPAKSVLMVGLRGVGKTVLLDRMRSDAEHTGLTTVRIESPESRSLPGILAPQLRSAILRLSRSAQAKELADRAMRALIGFVTALRVKFNDIEVGVDVEPEPGLADNGDLEHDLQDLFEAVGQAAERADSALAMFVDELQYVEEDQLAALIVALHRTSQRRLPVVLVGAGLPQLRGRMGKAKSYAERLFEFPDVGPLDRVAADKALSSPAIKEGAAFDESALAAIYDQTEGYPYYLQEWGKHAWDVADDSPITAEDVELATSGAIASLDASFFRVRFDRCTPSEKRYLRAMAERGRGPHRSGDIAVELDRTVQSLAPTRSNLINKGMVWSPSHGDTSFTVPLFDGFMKRIMPGQDWR